MKTIKQTAEFTILQRRDGRYAVRDAKRQFVRGDDKVKVLLAEGLINLTEPRADAPAADQQAAAAEADGDGSGSDQAETTE